MDNSIVDFDEIQNPVVLAATDISFSGFSPDEIISSEKNLRRQSVEVDKLDISDGLTGFVELHNQNRLQRMMKQ